MPNTALKPPAHLSQAAKKWFRSVIESFNLEDHDVNLLTLACEALDRCEQARVVLAKEGVTFIDRFGCPRAHPCVAIERDSRLAYARLLRELCLGDDVPDDTSRPPAIRNNRGY
jgi:P27 family predicted phage terminase small subunit